MAYSKQNRIDLRTALENLGYNRIGYTDYSVDQYYQEFWKNSNGDKVTIDWGGKGNVSAAIEEHNGSKRSLTTFQLTLKGYDGLTDKTDHLVKWVAAPSLEHLKRWLPMIPWEVEEIDTNPHYATTFEEGLDVIIQEDGSVLTSENFLK